MRPKLTGPGSGSIDIGNDEKLAIRQLIANGKAKTALDRAKDLHKQRPSADSEAILIDAYAARIQSLWDQNLALEAKSLQQLVRERFPSSIARLDALHAAHAASGGEIDALLAPLNGTGSGSGSELPPERRAEIELTLQNRVADLKAVADCAVLPPGHALRIAGAAVMQALAVVTSGPVTDQQLALPEVSHRSPFAPWKMLVRAIALLHRREDEACRECLKLIKPESVPGRLVPALQAMLGAPSPEPLSGPLSAAASALVARITTSPKALLTELEKLDQGFAHEASHDQFLKLMRAAMQECRRSAPGLAESLKRRLYVRAAMEGWDRERVMVALDGAPKHTATILREIARGLETHGDPSSVAAACEYWEDFRREAVREGWFAADGLEVATLYVHMAAQLGKLPSEGLEHFQRVNSHYNKDSYFLAPGELYERASQLDPHPASYAPWLAWAVKQSGTHGEEVAKQWHAARPMDIEPILHLARAYGDRDAFPTALSYLNKAEKIDAVHTVVRSMRFRLLAGAALRHLQQKKPNSAAEKLELMAALPAARQGNRPLFLAALGDLISASRYDEVPKQETAGLLGSEPAAKLLLGALAFAARRPELVIPPLRQKLTKAEQATFSATLLVAMAAAAGIAEELEIPQFQLPYEAFQEATKHFSKTCANLSTAQLLQLGEIAMANGRDEFAYRVSAAGLERVGPTQAAFLFLRAESMASKMALHLNDEVDDRIEACATAAMVLARHHRDSELAAAALAFFITEFGGEPMALTLDQAQEVVKRERGAPVYPLRGNGGGPQYLDMLEEKFCNCPDCRRKRGETSDSGSFHFDDDEPEFDEERMREMFDQRAPKDMSLEMLDLVFAQLKNAYLNPSFVDEALSRAFGDDVPGGKKKKGKRK